MSTPVNYDHYALRRDVAIIAKFISRISAHREKLAFYQMNPTTVTFPKPLGKEAKWPAYEAADRLRRSLNLDLPLSSVPELAAIMGEALKVTL